MKRLSLLLICVLAGCDRGYYLTTKVTGEEQRTVQMGSCSAEVSLFTLQNSEFAGSVQVIARDSATVFADRLHLELGGQPVSYEIRDEGEATEAKRFDLAGGEAKLIVYKWRQDPEPGDEFMLGASDFIRCGGEDFDLEPLSFVVAAQR